MYHVFGVHIVTVTSVLNFLVQSGSVIKLWKHPSINRQPFRLVGYFQFITKFPLLQPATVWCCGYRSSVQNGTVTLMFMRFRKYAAFLLGNIVSYPRTYAVL